MSPMPPMQPMYPSSFDMLTTHGIIADDLVGYVTGAPSPYLQQYVAQRGGVPMQGDILPGQILPDNLPHVMQGAQIQQQPQADIYQNPDINAPAQKDKTQMWKKIAAGVLLTALVTFGAIKAKDFMKNMNIPPSNGSSFKSTMKKFGGGLKNVFVTKPVEFFKKTGTGIKNKFKKKPATTV